MKNEKLEEKLKESKLGGGQDRILLTFLLIFHSSF